MTRIILGLILVAISLQSHGQIIVTGFEAKPMDLTASTHMRRDFNEQPCALVKVGLRAKDASFEGNIIGDTEMHTNEYWVYMTGGSKMLNIKHISAPSLLVRFSDYGVVALEPKMTYVLDLELPQPVAEQPVMQKVIINFSPSTAVVLLDGQMLDTNNGVATTSLPAGKDYSYTVAAKGYESSEGNFRLKATAPARLNIQLYPLETASVSQPAPPMPAQQEVTNHAFNSQGDTTSNNITDTTKMKDEVCSVLGCTFKTLSKEQQSKYSINGGIQILNLRNGKFKEAGIKENFIILEINGSRVKSQGDIEKIYDAIMKSSDPDKVMFVTGIYPTGKKVYYAVPLSD